MIERIVRDKKVNIIVITVGDLAEYMMEEIDGITKSAERAGSTGLRLSAKNTKGIERSFKKVIKEINSKGFANRTWNSSKLFL